MDENKPERPFVKTIVFSAVAVCLGFAVIVVFGWVFKGQILAMVEPLVRKLERAEYLEKIARHNAVPSEMMAVDAPMEHLPWPRGSGSKRLLPGTNRWHWNNSRYSTRVGLNEPALGEDRFRVINLGDSVCYGYGVADDETFTSVMESLRPDIDFVQLAAGGWSSGQELGALQAIADEWAPDAVVLHYVPNDPSPHTAIDRPERLFKYTESWTKERLNAGWNKLVRKMQSLLTWVCWEGMIGLIFATILVAAGVACVVGAPVICRRLGLGCDHLDQQLPSVAARYISVIRRHPKRIQTTLISSMVVAGFLAGRKPDVTGWERSFESNKFTRVHDYQTIWTAHEGQYDRHLEYSRDSLKQMQALCSDRNIPFMVLYHAGLPTPSRAEKVAEKKVAMWCQAMNEPFISYTSLYAKEGGFEQFACSSVDGHPNAKGHALIARQLLEDLSERRMIPTTREFLER